MTDIRCVKCHALLFKGRFFDLEIKCQKCGYVNRITVYGVSKCNKKKERLKIEAVVE